MGEKADTGDCLFCRIATGEMETEAIIEDDEFIAIWDKYPKAPVHALVIPRRHIAWLNDIGDVAAGGDEGFSQRMLDFVVRTAEKLEVADTGYRVINNVGSGGGQVIFHLHWHILAGGDRGFNIKEQL